MKKTKQKLPPISKTSKMKASPVSNFSLLISRIFSYKIILIGIFIVAIVIRFVYVYQLRFTPLFYSLASCAENYDKFAFQILHGNYFYKDLIYLNPFYTLFLGLVYFFCGYSHITVFYLQGIIDSINCLIIYYIASTAFNNKIGIIAGLMYAFYGIAVFYTGFLCESTMIVFLTLAFMGSIILSKEKENQFIFLISGILFGILFSGGENIVLFLLFLTFWFFTSLKEVIGMSKAIQGFLLLLFGALLVVLLIAGRNYLVYRNFYLLPPQSGINFYIGNNQKANGGYMYPRIVSKDRLEVTKSSIRYAREQVGRKLNPYQASRYWFLKGLEFIRDNPYRAFRLYVKKFALFWWKEELFLNINYFLSRDFIDIFKLPFLTFGSIVPLAVFGFILCLKWPNSSRMLIIYFIFSFLLSSVIYFITSQNRLPVVPFIIICSSCALYRCIELVRMKDLRRIVFISALLIIVYVGINIPSGYLEDNIEYHYNNIGKAYGRMGKFDMAVETLKKAIKINPNYAEPYNNLGVLYHKKGLIDGAIEEYNKALAHRPDFALVYNNLGNIYFEKELFNDAINQYEKALKIYPDYEIALYNIGLSYFKKGRIDKAIIVLERALKINPLNEEALTKLGLIYLGERRINDAIKVFKKALSLNPSSAETHYNLASAYNFHGDHILAQRHYDKASRLQED